MSKQVRIKLTEVLKVWNEVRRISFPLLLSYKRKNLGLYNIKLIQLGIKYTAFRALNFYAVLI